MSDPVQIAEAAARRAGAIIRDASQGTLHIVHKGAVDLVTQADLAAEEAIRAHLAEHSPGVPVLAEEGGGAADAATRWIVDPLDGTTNFVHGYPSYAVSIALQVDGRLEAGCIYDPIHDRAYTASCGGGAWCGEERLQVSTEGNLDQALLVTGFPYDRKQRVDDYLKCVRAFLLTAQGLRRAGAAAMDYVALAQGQVDGYWEFGLNPWDMAAGVLLVEEAGGRVTDMDLQPFDLERPRMLASNGLIHDQMGAVLHELITFS